MRKKPQATKYVQLQTRGIPSEVRDLAEERALEQGFNSLQDAVRIFIKQLADRKIKLKLSLDEPWDTTPELETRYEKEIAEIEARVAKGEVVGYSNVADMLKALDE